MSSPRLERESSVEMTRKLSAEERRKREEIDEARAAEAALQQSLDAELSVLEQQLCRPGTAPAALQSQSEPEPEPEPEPERRPASAGGAFASDDAGGGAGGGENVIVVCRVRPESGAERRQLASEQPLLHYGEDERSVAVVSPDGGRSAGTHSFGFRRVFGPTVEQQDVFDSVGSPMVDAVLDGFNAAMICYGQTGAGKSYTMLGSEAPDASPAELGLLPRTTQALFAQIRERSGGRFCDVVRASFIEIYMERATDLLNGGGGGGDLAIREDKMKNVYIAGALEVVVSSATEVTELLRLGLKSRQTGFTGSNAVSSRSHAIFILTVESSDSERHVTKTSQLYCCDLAGSEKIDKTITSSMSGAEAAKVLKEGQKINTSLLALGNVIAALAKQQPRPATKRGGAGGRPSASPPPQQHIPYRDSKLTRLLKNSFGGNARTAVVVCCSPSPLNAAETLSTLRFGDRSQQIQNVATQNIFRSAKELEVLLASAEKQLESAQRAEQRTADENERLRAALRRALTLSGGGGGGGAGRGLALGDVTRAGGSLPSDVGGAMDSVDMVAAAYAQPARHTVSAARRIHDGTADPCSGSALLAATISSGDGGGGGAPGLVDGLGVTGLICPLTRGILYDPVVAADGWTYERAALLAYWRAHGLRSPVGGGGRLESRSVVPNKALGMVVNGFFTEAQREAAAAGGRPDWFDYLPHDAVVRIFDHVALSSRRGGGGGSAAAARDLCRLCQVSLYFLEVGAQRERWNLLLLDQGGGSGSGGGGGGGNPKDLVKAELLRRRGALPAGAPNTFAASAAAAGGGGLAPAAAAAAAAAAGPATHSMLRLNAPHGSRRGGGGGGSRGDWSRVPQPARVEAAGPNEAVPPPPLEPSSSPSNGGL